MFEQAELQGTQMGPNGPPIQKERLKSPPKSLIIENQAFGVILAILAKQPIWSFWSAMTSHFRARVDTPAKSPTWGIGCLNQLGGATHGGDPLRSTTAPRQNSSAGGVVAGRERRFLRAFLVSGCSRAAENRRNEKLSDSCGKSAPSEVALRAPDPRSVCTSS